MIAEAWIALATIVIAVVLWDVARRWISARKVDDVAELRATIHQTEVNTSQYMSEASARLDKHEDAIRNHKAQLDQLLQKTDRQALSQLAGAR